MDRKKTSFLNNLLFKDYRFIFSLWIITSVICGLLKYFRGSYNNYRIFKNLFWHALHQLPLYNHYPKEYFDITHYGVFFSSLISPFSILPDILGVVLWVSANAWLLYYAIRKLAMSRNQHLFVYLFCIIELYNSLCSQQFNVGIAAIIILAYHLIEKKKDFWAAFFIMLGTFTKVYGIMGLAFLPFSRNKTRFLFSCLFWSVIMFFFPMLYTSPDYVWVQYHSWIIDIIEKNNQNLFAYYQNISLLGMVRKISGSSSYSDLWLIISGLILFCLPYIRIKQYRSKSFRMLILASTLLFTVLFSTASESSSYIIAMTGIAIWYIKTPSQTTSFNLTLLIFAFFLTGLSSSDLFPTEVREIFVFPFALKSLPCFIIWLKISYELCFLNFCLKEGIPKREESPRLEPNQNNEIDIILPCYNPTANWQEVIHENMKLINKFCPDKVFHVIVVDDGSSVNMNNAEIEKFKTIMPRAQFISYSENRGKGYAVRKGMETACSSMIIYSDWNFPYDKESLRSVINKLEEGYDVVVAARTNSYFKNFSMNTLRSYLSILPRMLNWIVLGMRFSDAQGGLKGMNRKGKELFLKTKIDQFLFDTEFVYMASRDRDLHICETKANLHKGMRLSFMNMKVLGREVVNFIRIAQS